MILAPHSSHPSSNRAPLCPCCGSTRVRITTSILAHFDVVFDSPDHDFRVVDELLGDAMWDDDTGVVCPNCSWSGTVRDLGQHAASRD